MDQEVRGLQNDEQNLQQEDQLEKFRQNNREVSLFIFKQGRQNTWMPDKTSYIGFDNLMKRTSKPMVIKSELRKQEGDQANPDQQGYCEHTVLFEE